MIRELESLPNAEPAEAEPYFSLWSALCHQGDIYTASYAALPHVIAIMERNPARAPMTLFLMIASIEISRRNGKGPEIPADLEESYAHALSKVPALVGAASAQEWDHWLCGAALAAVAATQGQSRYAEAILELGPEEIDLLLRKKYDE
jgi:hypothetical protein